MGTLIILGVIVGYAAGLLYFRKRLRPDIRKNIAAGKLDSGPMDTDTGATVIATVAAAAWPLYVIQSVWLWWRNQRSDRTP